MRLLMMTGGVFVSMTAVLLAGCGSTGTPNATSLDGVPTRYGLYAVDGGGDYQRLDGDKQWEVKTWSERSDLDRETAFLVFYRGIGTSPKPLSELIRLYRVSSVRHDVRQDGGFEDASRPRWTTVEREEFRVPLDFGPVPNSQDAVLAVPREKLALGLYTLQYEGGTSVHASRLGIGWSTANKSQYAMVNCVDRYVSDSGSPQYRLCSEEAPGTGLRIHVTSSRQRRTATGRTLSVEGTIENASDKTQSIPSMLLTLSDQQGRPVEQRVFDPGVRNLAPGQSTVFSKEFHDPSPTASRVVVAFSEQGKP